jgi:hypothetical protein
MNAFNSCLTIGVAAALLIGCTGNPVSIGDSVPSVKNAAAQPDLIVTALSFVSNSGGFLTYRVTVKNSGAATVPSLQTVTLQGLYSDNMVFGDAGDIGAGGFVAGNGSLGPGQKKDIECKIPEYSWSSYVKKYLIVKIDYANTVAESNEWNNLYLMNVLPDLKITDFRITTGPGSPTISTSVTIQNQGKQTIPDIYGITFQANYSIW